MVRKTLTLFFALLVIISVNAQKKNTLDDKNHVSKNSFSYTDALIDYAFNESTAVFTSINGTGIPIAPPTWDDDRYFLDLTGSFSFEYNENTYSSFSIGTNGPILLGADAYITLSNDLNGTLFPVVAGLWDDLRFYGEGLGDGLFYQLDGIPGNQILTVEWYNVARYSYEGFQVSFQVKLYEANGMIEVIYGDMSAAVNWVASASIGINDDEGGAVFWSVTPGAPATVSSTVSNNTIDQATIAAIAEGTLYSFSAGSEVTFQVDDGSNPVQNAYIYISGGEYITDALGEAIITLPDGTYDYDVIASGFQNYSNFVTVAGLPITEPVTLSPGTDEWPTIFTVTGEDIEGGTIILENADVTFDGLTQQTDVNGQTTFYNPVGTYDFSVVMPNYDDINIMGAGVGQGTNIQDVIMSLIRYTVTVNVAENFGSNNPIEGASVSVTNTTKANWEETTDASGNAYFDLPITSYDYTVSADGYADEPGSFTVIDQNITENVLLDEDLAAPTGLTVEVNDNDADFSWYAGFGGNLLIVDHDATNDIVDFTDDWPYVQTALDLTGLTYDYYESDAATHNGPDLVTMQNYDAIVWFTGEGWQLNQTMTSTDETNLSAYLDGGGKLFLSSQDYIWDVYSQNATYTFSSGQFPYDYLGAVSVTQDAWWSGGGESLTHEGVVGSLAEGFSFVCDDIYTTTKEGLAFDEITSHSGVDMLNVTTAPAGLTAVQNGNTVFWAGSFASITDDQTRADFLMAVLDYLATSKDKSFESFNVYLDDLVTPVATGVIDSSYSFTDLTYGSHTAGVQAVYTTGSSTIATIDFDLFELYTITFHITDNNGGANLEGAHIVLTDEIIKTVWEGDTDADGLLTFNDVLAGDYEYSVTLDGYQDILDVNLTVSMSETIDVGMDEAVGFNEIGIENIQIYPNPSTGLFNINTDEELLLEITDITGKTIIEKLLNPGMNQIDVKNAGLYFMHFIKGTDQFTVKIIVN